MTQDHFNQVAHVWDQIRRVESDQIQKLFTDLDLQFAASVLDIGCGTGVLVDYLPENIDYTGIDFAESMIEVARKKYPGESYHWITGDAQSFPFKQTFEWIILYAVFPHFKDQKETIQYLSRYLESNGKLLIFHSSSKEKVNEIHNHLPAHVVSQELPPITKLVDLIDSCGLHVSKSEDSSEIYYLLAEK